MIQPLYTFFHDAGLTDSLTPLFTKINELVEAVNDMKKEPKCPPWVCSYGKEHPCGAECDCKPCACGEDNCQYEELKDEPKCERIIPHIGYGKSEPSELERIIDIYLEMENFRGCKDDPDFQDQLGWIKDFAKLLLDAGVGFKPKVIEGQTCIVCGKAFPIMCKSCEKKKKLYGGR